MDNRHNDKIDLFKDDGAKELSPEQVSKVFELAEEDKLDDAAVESLIKIHPDLINKVCEVVKEYLTVNTEIEKTRQSAFTALSAMGKCADALAELAANCESDECRIHLATMTRDLMRDFTTTVGEMNRGNNKSLFIEIAKDLGLILLGAVLCRLGQYAYNKLYNKA